MANTPPTKAGEMHISQSQKYLRVIDADTGDVVQLSIVDTGTVTVDGLSIYALGVTGAGGAPLPTTAAKPNTHTSNSIAMDGTLIDLPVTTDAMYVWLKSDDDNGANIYIFDNTPLGPGESIVIETDDDASWIQARGTLGDTLYYSILRRA